MMSTVNIVSVVINILGATLSTVINATIAARTRQPLRSVYIMVSALSLVYVGVFTATLIAPSDTEILHAQFFGTGVAMLAWPLVWILPTITTYHLTRESKEV